MSMEIEWFCIVVPVFGAVRQQVEAQGKEILTVFGAVFFLN